MTGYIELTISTDRVLWMLYKMEPGSYLNKRKMRLTQLLLRKMSIVTIGNLITTVVEDFLLLDFLLGILTDCA